MPEQLVRPVQVRVELHRSTDALTFEIRVPRQAIEASAMDPEGIAESVAQLWARLLRDALNLPASSGGVHVLSPREANAAIASMAEERD